MVSKRIKTIISLINEDDKILDIGTDHALIPIYLIRNNITKVADGSDISNNVLINAKENIIKANLDNKINLFLSDGVKNIDTSKYNTFIITGMGFTTIKNILSLANLNNIKKLIIQSNNDLFELRKYLNEINYKLDKEVCLKDKRINYTIICASKGKELLSEQELYCGKFDKENIWYYQEIIQHFKKIYPKITDTSKKNLLLKIISYFEEYTIKEKI